MKQLKRFSLLFLMVFLGFHVHVWSQVNISAGNTITQDFNDIGTSATATLPSGWKADKNTTVRTVGNYSEAGDATERRAGDNMLSTAGNGIYNYGAGDAASADDRAVGGLSSGSASKSVNIYVQLFNNGSTPINSLTISYNVEKYRNGSNPAGFTIQMYYSTDGSTWTGAGDDFKTSFTPDDNSNGFPSAPGITVNVDNKTLNQSITAGNSIYLAWNYSVTEGSITSSAQALGIDDVSITANGETSPNISVNPSSLSGFSYVFGAGPSSEKSFTVSGQNLTGNITLTAPTDYEISLSAGSDYTNTINLEPTGGNVDPTTIYTRLKSGLSVGVYNESITASSTGATSQEISCSGAVLNTEPANHVTNFTANATSSSEIGLTWTDADASSYLIKGSYISFTDIEAPVDGVPETDGTLVKNVASGAQSYTFTGLSPNQAYYFKIYPYNGTGGTINYKTSPDPPQATATTQLQPTTTYTWIGDDGASWGVASNWEPNRTTPQSTDILVFNSGTKTVTAVPTQTIGQLKVTDGAKIILQASGGNTLTINGDEGDDLYVASGCELNISGSNALTISLGADATGNIAGSMTFSGGTHKLTASSQNSIIFTGSFTAGSGFTGNAFGTTPPESVIFQSGSTYIFMAGSNPFGASNSVVVFQTGSLYSHRGSNTPSFSGRTYADFELDYNGTITPTGSSKVSIDNLTVKQGILNFNMTDNPGHSIKGNINVFSGATLNFNPGSAGTVCLNGTSSQTISGEGTISANNYSTIQVDNTTGVLLNKTASLQNMTVSSDAIFNLSPTAALTLVGNLSNYGTFSLQSDATGTGSFILNGNYSESSTFEIERYMTGGWGSWDAGWHFLSSPVQNQAINDFTTTGLGNDYDFYGWRESDGMWINYKGGDFSTWNGSTNFVVGRGYMVSYEQTQSDKKFIGTPNNANVPFSNLSYTELSPNKGWNLLGNPFPSALKWNDGNWSLTSVAGTAKIWNSDNKSYSDIAANGIIPIAQGFMVQVDNSTNSLTIPTASRTHNNTAWYKSGGNDRILLVARPTDKSSAQESIIRIEEGATEGFDFYHDSRFLSGGAPQFYCIIDDELLSTQALPSINNGMEFLYGFAKNDKEEFEIVLAENPFPVKIYLEDLKTGLTQNLSDNPAFVFTSTEGDSPIRFKLSFGSVGIDETTANDVRLYYSNNVLYMLQMDGYKQIEVLNLNGQLIRKMNTDENYVNLPLARGIYLVRITSAHQAYVQKIIVQ